MIVNPHSGTIHWTNDYGQQAGGWVNPALGTSGPFGGVSAASIGLGASVDGALLFFTSFDDGALMAAPAEGNSHTVIANVGGGSGGAVQDWVTGRIYYSRYAVTAVGSINPDGSNPVSIPSIARPWGSPAVSGAGALDPASVVVELPASGVGSGTLALRNSGDYPIQLFTKQFSGTPGFSTGAGCGIYLGVGDTCFLTIEYSGAAGAAATLSIVTDAGTFEFPVSASSTGPTDSVDPPTPLVRSVRAATRCASSARAGNLSIRFSSATATRVTVRLQRSSTRLKKLPTRCPSRAKDTGFASKRTGKQLRTSFTANVGNQAKTVRQLFGKSKLAPGRYSLRLSYTDAGGGSVVRTTWFWVLRPRS